MGDARRLIKSSRFEEDTMRRIRNARGFSIVELLVAITIIAIGVLAVAGLMPLARRSTIQSGDVTRAIEYAQQKMEELKNLEYDEVTSGSDSTGIFRRSWIVDEDIPMEDMKRITTKVTWITGSQDTVELVTYIGKR